MLSYFLLPTFNFFLLTLNSYQIVLRYDHRRYSIMKLPRAHHISAEELTGQLIMPALHLGFVNRNSSAARRILQWVHRYHVTGFILFGGHPAGVRFWTDFLQKESKYPMLFAADLERGLHSVFSGGAMFPHALSFGAAGKEEHVVRFAEVLAKEARSVGINVIFAPVLDLADGPENPIINIRALHSDPEVVARYGQLFIETVQKYGIACVGKHFPGHGSTVTDSHVDLPVLKRDFARLQKLDLVPFQKAHEAGVKGMMAGHLKLKEFELPASLEPGIIQKFLRDKWRYEGVVFTDALEMGAIERHFKTWQQALYPVHAGADILLMPQNSLLTHQLLHREIQTNAEFRKTAEAALERVFRLKKWIHREQPAQSHPYRVFKVIGHPRHLEAARKVAEESVTLLRRSNRFPLDLPKIRSIRHLIFTDARFDDQPLQYFCFQMQRFFDSVEILNNPSLKKIQSLPGAPNSATIISVYFRTFAGHPQKMDWQRVNHLIRELKKHRMPLIFFLFGNPYHVQRFAAFEECDAVFLCYSYVQAAQEAAFSALCSFTNITGKLPVRLERPFHSSIQLASKPYVLESALEIAGWKEVDRAVETAIATRVFPGGIALAVQQGKVVLHRAYGRFDYDDKSPQVEADTIYDLASLTKVVAATPAVMRLVERGELDLQQSLLDFYPQLAKDIKAKISVADLLLHQSGLPAWKPFYKELQPRAGSSLNKLIILDQILRTPLEYKTGEKTVYSDLGFILLADIIEQVTATPFDQFCREQIFQPMGLPSLQFNPPAEMSDHIPPTGGENWRGGIIQGAVNDNNCFAMGGVSAHAGLFGNAWDVAAIGQLFIQKGIYKRRRHFRQRTIELFASLSDGKLSRRALGWDVPGDNSSSGKFFSKHTIGHLGFTGCSMWVDLEQEIIVVFLCNRAHPDPGRNQINEFRPQFHDAIMKTLKSQD